MFDMELLQEIDKENLDKEERNRNRKKYCEFTPEQKRKTREYQKKYYYAHKQKCLDLCHTWYMKHRTEILQKIKEERTGDPDYKQYQREQYLKRKKMKDGRFI
jgi:hypothetical protein